MGDLVEISVGLMLDQATSIGEHNRTPGLEEADCDNTTLPNLASMAQKLKRDAQPAEVEARLGGEIARLERGYFVISEFRVWRPPGEACRM